MDNELLAHVMGLAETVGRATPRDDIRRKQIRSTWLVRGPVVDGKINEGEPRVFNDSISAFVYAVNSYPNIGMSNSRRLCPYTWDQTDEVAIYGKTRPLIENGDGTVGEAPYQFALDMRFENIDLTNVLIVIRQNAWPYGAAIHGVRCSPAPPIKNKTGKYILTDIRAGEVNYYDKFEEVIAKIKNAVGVASHGTILSHAITDVYEEYRVTRTENMMPAAIREAKDAGVMTMMYGDRIVLTI